MSQGQPPSEVRSWALPRHRLIGIVLQHAVVMKTFDAGREGPWLRWPTGPSEHSAPSVFAARRKVLFPQKKPSDVGVTKKRAHPGGVIQKVGQASPGGKDAPWSCRCLTGEALIIHRGRDGR